MAFYVYMLQSKGAKSVTYVGYTNNLSKRITQHNNSKGAEFTEVKMEINLQNFSIKKRAISREYYIKKNRTFRNKIKNKFKLSRFYYIKKIFTRLPDVPYL